MDLPHLSNVAQNGKFWQRIDTHSIRRQREANSQIIFEQLPNIKPAHQTAPLIRKLVLHPVAMLAFFCQTTFFFLFYSQNRYGLSSTFDQFTLTFSWGFIYFCAFYAFMGQGINFLVSRNVPVALGYFAYFSVMAFLEAAFGHIFYRNDHGLIDFLWHVFSTQFALVPAIIICSFFYEKQVRHILGLDPEAVPYWKPVQRDENPLLSQLPAHKRGKVLRLQSANQYVEVTTENGTHDLRATLKSVLDAVPANEGIHIHRSIWVHRDQIREFRYKNGNPCVIDVNGKVIPVSRSKVDDVKNLLLYTG